ncbi:MAG: GspH/FimT family protein [Methylovulum sp.]|jgi:general secretion pathway protein H|nr:GspH/FimT family protein [Methylovulum sp.]MCF7997647.1 GspH/FimT family protein [Methylovulum sp.]
MKLSLPPPQRQNHSPFRCNVAAINNGVSRLPRQTQQQGFTLIEVIVVLVIVILGFSAIGVNISSGNDTAKMKAAAHDIVSALRYARGQALMDHEPTTVDFDLEHNSYTVSNRDKVFNIPDEISLTVVTAQSELTGQGQGSIRFYGDGSSTGGRVTLERDKAKLQIDINWLTGASELSDTFDEAL